MISSRNEAQNNNPKLIDNLERVADNLVSSLAALDRTRELMQPINNANEKYTRPLKSWIWFPFYMWWRKRGPVINALIATINQRGSSETLIDAIDQFLSFGGWETTSVNTYLMKELALILPGYSDTRDDFSLKHKDILRLKCLFLQRTNNILRPTLSAQKEAELDDILTRRHKEEVQSELEKLPQRNVRQDGEILRAANVFKAAPQRKRRALDDKFSALRAALELHFQDRLARSDTLQNSDYQLQPVRGKASMQFDVNKLDPQRVLELEQALSHKMAADAQLIDTQSEQGNSADDFIVTPPPSPKLSAAAFEATHATQPYVASERRKLSLTDSQLRAMNRLFSEPLPEDKSKESQDLKASPTARR